MDMTEKEKAKPSSSWIRTVVPAVLAAAVFGVAGYLITPKSAQSAIQKTEQDLGGLQSRLDKTLSDGKQLSSQLAQTKVELASAEQHAETAEATVSANKVEIATAEQRITGLSEELEQAKQTNESLVVSKAQAEKLAADSKAKVQQAQSRVGSLATQLATAQSDRQKLGRIAAALQTDRKKIVADLASQKRTAVELKRFIALLEIGEKGYEQGAEHAWQTPVEKPITTGELIRQMGYPSLTFQRLEHVGMRWGEDHTVLAAGGLITEIDGQTASRSVLASVAVAPPMAVDSPGQWRVVKGKNLYYADMVAMYGRPERIAGTGSKFTAWWPVGAWARTVPATVIDGVVTEFAGRKTDPELCCELVRQNTSAYKSPTQSVRANAAAARASWCRAREVIAGKLQAESRRRTREGGPGILKWNIAPLGSAGTWIGPANASSGSTIVRVWVDCTWVKGDGSTTNQRRYAVVILFGKDQQIETAEYSIFAPRD